jgi:hypothetical protein
MRDSMPVNHLIETFMQGHSFAPIMYVIFPHIILYILKLTSIVTRTRDFRPPKPDPAGILHIASEWGLPDAKNLIMVGDSIDDMTAGYRAGAATVLLVNEVNAHLATHEHTDLCIRRLDELIKVLEGGFVAEVGQGEDSVDAKGMAEEAMKRG